MKSLMSDTTHLLSLLNLAEEPFGVYYSNNKPDGAFGPKKSAPANRAIEDKGEIDWGKLKENFSCIIGNIWLARKKHGVAYISAEEYGCFGGMYYSGVEVPYIRSICNYVTTGFLGTPMKGERYMPSPESMEVFLEQINVPKAPAKYCLFKPLSLFIEEQPEFITFFARPEVLSGLVTLLFFTTGDVNALATPFGAGCTCLVSWPLYYRENGLERAVLGGFDPSARKFFKTDELTFTVSLDVYKKMLAAAPESLLYGATWEGVSKKCARSNIAWGEKIKKNAAQ